MANVNTKLKDLPQNNSLASILGDILPNVITTDDADTITNLFANTDFLNALATWLSEHGASGIDINALFADTSFLTALQSYLNTHSGVVNLNDLIDALTSSSNFIDSLTSNSDFLTFLTDFLTDQLSELTAEQFVNQLTANTDFLNWLHQYLVDNGFVNLAGLVTALTTDADFTTFLTNFLSSHSGDITNTIDYPALIAALLADSDFTDAIQAFITANADIVNLGGEVFGASNNNFVRSLFGRPIQKVAPLGGLDDFFNDNTFDTAKWAVLSDGGVPTIVEDNNGLTITMQNTDSLASKKVGLISKAKYNFVGTRVECWLRSFTRLAGSGGNMRFLFGIWDGDAGDVLNPTNFGNANVSDNNLSGALGGRFMRQTKESPSNIYVVNKGDAGAAGFSNPAYPDFSLFRLQDVGGRTYFRTGGEHGGWSEITDLDNNSFDTSPQLQRVVAILVVPPLSTAKFNLAYISSTLGAVDSIPDGAIPTYSAATAEWLVT